MGMNGLQEPSKEQWQNGSPCNERIKGFGHSRTSMKTIMYFKP